MTENSGNNEDQLVKKQELLKKEIISKDYDPNKFLQFCLYQKENGDDMNNWTYDELKQCVERFIEGEESEKLKKEKSEKDNLENNKEKDVIIISNGNQNETKGESNDTNKETNKNKTNDTIEKEENIIKKKIHEISCKALKKSLLNNKDIKVTIKNPKTNEKLLSSSYVTYEVFTEPICWSVRRRYSDFLLLRHLLCKYYPKKLIPPLPEKKVGNKRFQQQFIESRMHFLQLFMNDIIKNEEFKANEALIVFLNFNDHTQFEKKMKELNSYTPSHNFDDIQTLSGKLNILDEDYASDKYLTTIGNFCKSQKNLFNKLNISLKSYFENISLACQSLEEISKSFEELFELNAGIEIKEEVPKTYNILSFFFKEYKQMMSKENEIIHIKIKRFFKLQKLLNNSYLEIVEQRENLKQKYMVENNKLYAKKEKLYSIKDINKWEIIDIDKLDKPRLLRDKDYAFQYMCQKDNLNVDNIYKNLAYANYMIFVEFENIVNINIKSYVDNVKEIAKQIYPYFNNRMTLWEKLNSYI